MTKQSDKRAGAYVQELDRENSEDSVFKLVGPALIKQDPLEARGNVGKRLDFIRRELERLALQSDTLSQRQARKQQQVSLLWYRIVFCLVAA